MALERLIELQKQFKQPLVTPLVKIYLTEKANLSQYKQSSDMALYKVKKYLINKYQK